MNAQRVEQEQMNAIRGIVIGVLLSIPFWIVLGIVVGFVLAR